MSKMRFFALQELANRRPVKVDYPSEKLADYYGNHVFDRKKMQEYLPSEAYKAVINAIEKGTPINREMADMIANGMKNWAKTFNVTHYTHWFQPLTDGTAEKHDGFIEFGDDGNVIERFSGKLLIQQEPDASSFPNGGIRNTFEARGYTAWDVSSPAFIVDSTLCIPTIFISYTGEALDYKTPLLKALGAVDKAATEVCRMFDPNVKRVFANLGWEQEYFLVDTALYNARPDLCLTGRTLMGHSSAKDQQLDDHYFGSIPPRVTSFMKELELECHKLGIPVKTRHNEVAPNQFELAPIFEDVNLANDHNQLVMDLMKRIASKHNFTVLLHEKPFKGVNGSGKHNNWSLCTDTGINLFSPAKTAEGNMLFLTFIVNVLMMVYKNQDLLRASRYYISKYQKDFSVFISKFDCIDKETQEMYMSELSNKYINLIKDMSGCDDEVMIANYVIYVSYQNLSSSKIMAWNVFGDYIIKNLKDNSNPRKVIRITEAPYKTNDTYEYLGKNYYMTSEGE